MATDLLDRSLKGSNTVLYVVRHCTSSPTQSFAGSPSTQGSYLIQNQNTQVPSKFYQWSPSSWFPAFAGDWKGRERRIMTKETHY